MSILPQKCSVDDDLGNPPQWIEAVEASLEVRRNASTEIGDTAYGALRCKKRDIEIVYKKMSAKEKDSFRWVMDDGGDHHSGRRQQAIPATYSNLCLDNT